MQLYKSVSLFCLSAVSAITITSPARDNSARLVAYNNGTFTVTWSSVSTDPTQINIELSTNNGQSTTTVATNVNTSANQYAVDLTGVTPGSNYGINLASASTTNTGILAQSGTFTVEQGAVVSSAPAGSSSTAMVSSPVSSGVVAGSSAAADVSATRSVQSGSAVPSSTGAAAGASGSSGASVASPSGSSAASATSGTPSPVASGSAARISSSAGASASPSTAGSSGSETKSAAGRTVFGFGFGLISVVFASLI